MNAYSPGLVDSRGNPLRPEARADLVAPGQRPLYRGLPNTVREVMASAPRLSGNRETKMTRPRGVAAARALWRDNELVAGGLERRALSVVGADIRVIPMPNIKVLQRVDKRFDAVWAREFADQAEAAFSEWADDDRCLCDAEGHYGYGGLMLMAHHNLIGPEGECVGILRTDPERQERYNAPFATFLEILDPERLFTPPALAGDPDVEDGRRLDKHGRYTALYISKDYPGENRRGGAAMAYETVPRETAWGRPVGMHWFRKWRGGVQRGLTDLVRSIRKVGLTDKLDEAIITAALVNAKYALTVRSDLDPKTVRDMMSSINEDPMGFLDDARIKFYSENEITVDGHPVVVLPQGDEFEMATSNRSTDDPSALRRTFHRDLSVNLRTSAPTTTNDHSDTNYSSERSGMLNEWRGYAAERKLFGKHFMALPYGAIVEEAIALGRIEMPRGFPDFDRYRGAYVACEFSGPSMGHVDPEKEAKANRLKLESGMGTLSTIGSDYGLHWRDSTDQLAAEIAYFDEKELIHPYVLRMMEAQKGATVEDEPTEDNDDKDARDAR